MPSLSGMSFSSRDKATRSLCSKVPLSSTERLASPWRPLAKGQVWPLHVSYDRNGQVLGKYGATAKAAANATTERAAKSKEEKTQCARATAKAAEPPAAATRGGREGGREEL